MKNENDASLAFATIEELAALLAKRKISPGRVDRNCFCAASNGKIPR